MEALQLRTSLRDAGRGYLGEGLSWREPYALYEALKSKTFFLLWKAAFPGLLSSTLPPTLPLHTPAAQRRGAQLARVPLRGRVKEWIKPPK